MLNRRIKWYSALNKDKGFTLVELVVTMAVLLVITSMALAKYPDFNQFVALKKTSQEIALVIRQAQAYGLGVREFVAGSNEYPGYGVYFSGMSPDDFLLYADRNNNNGFDLMNGELVERFYIKTGDRIVNICGLQGVNYMCGLITLNIVYLRPSPVVTIRGNGFFDFSFADIYLQSPNGKTKKITVWKSGQISVE